MGQTLSGKSHLARQMFLSATATAPGLVIDPADSNLTAGMPGTVNFSDPSKATNEHGQNWRTARIARFVPIDPDDRATYGQVYAWAFDRFPRYVWCDEAGAVFPAQGTHKSANRLIVQGSKRQLGHLALHTRPRELNRNLIAQARQVIVFQLPDTADRQHIASLAEVPFAHLEAAMAQLGEHGFVTWRQGPGKELVVVADGLPR